jgi:hypothetical protein
MDKFDPASYNRPNMRVIVLSESPAAEGLAGQFVEAARSFNRGLDIRLRFLDVGFEIRSLSVPREGELPEAGLDRLLATFSPNAALILGGGPRLLECAAVVAKAGPHIAYVLDKKADRTALAIAELAGILVAGEEGALTQTRSKAMTHVLLDGQPAGPALVDILVRSVREKRTP